MYTKQQLRDIADGCGIWFRQGWKVEDSHRMIVGALRDRRAHLQAMLDNNHYHRNSYFWRSNGSAAQRQKMELERAMAGRWVIEGVTYTWDQDVRVTATKYYFTNKVKVDGQKKTVRAMSTLLGQISALLAELERP